MHKENTIQAGRLFSDVDDRDQQGEHRLLQHIRGQNSTVSPPRPQKMKLHMHGGADTSTGARAKEIKGQHQNTPSMSTHTHRRESATEDGREATGVVIFRPKMEPNPANRIMNENDGTTVTPNKYLTTRKRCKGTVYRLAQVGRSNHPGQQMGPCFTHQRPNNNSQHVSTAIPEWTLQQTTDKAGNDNFHQNENGKLITTAKGHPHCNYCKLPSHSRQRCAFRLRDLEHNIDRLFHPRKGRLVKNDVIGYSLTLTRTQSLMSNRLARETDNTGNHKYWQTEQGHIIYNIDNQPQCSYCGIPSHGRDNCCSRRNDEQKGTFRIYHPQRGNLQSGNKILSRSSNRTTPKHKPRLDIPRRTNDHAMGNLSYGNIESGITTQRHPNVNHTGIRQRSSNTESNPIRTTGLTDMPSEIMQLIMSYLPFRQIMRLKRVNKRINNLTMMTALWKEIHLTDVNLNCSLITTALQKNTTVLNLKKCTIQGSHTQMTNMGNQLAEGTSRLEFVGLQAYKGNDTLASLIVAESKHLDTLDMSETRYTLVRTVINKIKPDNKITAINLSAVGGHYAEMGGLVYQPFDLNHMRPLVNKCRHLTDVVFFGSKLSHDAITFFCDNAPPTLLRLNIARERAYNDDIRALTISCPHLQYLNIAETSVAYQDIITIVLAWRRTMINLCLPHRLGFVLTLRSRAPNLPLISQFETLINQMECLEYLHVGHYKFHQADIDNRSPQVSRLKRMFPNLQINHNPYTTGPYARVGNHMPQSDPSFRFRANIKPDSWSSRHCSDTLPVVALE